MESLWASIAVAATIFFLFAGLAALWQQRRHVADLQRDLAWSEQSRLRAEQQVLDGGVPVDVLSDPSPTDTDRGQRRAVLDQTLQRMQRPHAAEGIGAAWVDTEPMARPDALSAIERALPLQARSSGAGALGGP